MAFEGTTGVVARIDAYTRTGNVIGALTTLPAKDIESISFQLPNAKVVRVDGLAEIYEYMTKIGKWVMPDMQIVLRTDISSGAPLATSAYGILGRPEEAAAASRTFDLAIASGMKIVWEVHQDSVNFDLPKDSVIMSTHNIKHAEGTAPVITGF